VAWKKNRFEWSPEQQQAFEEIKKEIIHAVALVEPGQHKTSKICTTLQPGRMALPGVCSRKQQERLKINPWAFEVRYRGIQRI